MSKDAQQLVRDLGGIETLSGPAAGGTPGLSEALHQEEKRLDKWRILLGQALSHFANAIAAIQSGATDTVEQETAALLETCARLVKKPSHDGRILLRYRGRRPEGLPGDIADREYAAFFGNIGVDLYTAKAVMTRKGALAVDMYEDLGKAFSVFSRNNISTLYISLENSDPEQTGDLAKSVRVALDYFAAMAARSARRSGDQDASPARLALIRDERGEFDACFSILCALNSLKADTARALMRKISGVMQKAGVGDPLEQFVGAYDAVFAFRNLREKLKQPRVEVNNPRWLINAHQTERASRQKVKLVRAASQAFQGSPKTVARLLDGMYASDYGRIEAGQLVERLGLCTEFLRKVSTPADEPPDDEFAHLNVVAESTIMEILGNVETNLDRIRDSVYEDVDLTEESLVAYPKTGLEFSAPLDGRLYDLVSFFRQRAVTKRKMKAMVREDQNFEPADYQTIARDFSITVKNAQELVRLFGSCFDDSGRFLRRDFERNIPAFSRHEKKVFEFLWYYLKEIMDRHDRIAFLNALQLLIDQMQLPKTALTVLFDDFCGDPETVSYSDRNALMLSNLLLRKYNKELHNDIEITPEEVLLVREGLNPDAVDFCAGLIAEEQENFFRKIRSVHGESRRALSGDSKMPVRYLLTLEREVYILLSLIGGPTARAVVRSAAKEYGNPGAEIYRMANSEEYFSTLVQILQVAVRGLGRVGETSDLVFLDDLGAQEQEFISRHKDGRSRDLIKRALRYVETSKQDITRKRWSR
ncbi:MAG: hypothetical protein ACLFOY_02550 [Desulfatibacillaceae bacterium]